MTFYRVTFVGHMVDGEEWNCTWHVNHAGGAAATVAAAAVTAFGLMWNGVNVPAGNVQAHYPTTIGVDLVRVDELDGSDHNVAQVVSSMSLAGTAVTEALPANVAVCVSIRSALPSKAGRGRFFMPSPVVGVLLAQKLLTATQTDFKNGALAAMRSMSAAGCQVVIHHRTNGNVDPVVEVDVGDVPDVQNRRRNQTAETRVVSTV